MKVYVVFEVGDMNAGEGDEIIAVCATPEGAARVAATNRLSVVEEHELQQ